MTKRIEDAVSNITGVKNVTSTITEGTSTTVDRVPARGRHADRAVNDVKDAVERIRSDLPATIEEPVVSRIDVEGQADPDLCGVGAGDDARKSCPGTSTTP